LAVIKACTADPKGIAGRIKVSGAFNEEARSLWDSSRCPPALAKERGVDRDSSPGRLLAALLPLRLDLLEPTSQALPEAIGWCRQALIPEQAGDADDLWKALCDLVTELAPSGGVLDAAMIGARLGTRFAIRNRPDLEPDWELLARHTREYEMRLEDLEADDLKAKAKAWTEAGRQVTNNDGTSLPLPFATPVG
jgi:hypothetical protein